MKLWPIDTPKLLNTKWLNEVQINQNAKGVRGTNGGKGKYLADSTDDSRVSYEPEVPNLPSLLGHTTLWVGLAFLTFQLS